MNSRNRHFPLFGKITLGLMTLLILLSGWVLYQQITSAIKDETERALASIADHKRQEIEDWLADTRNDADVYFQGTAQLPWLLDQWLNGGRQDARLLERMRAHMNQLATARHWSGLTVYDNAARPIFTVGEPGATPDTAILMTVERQAKVEILDLHLNAGGQVVYEILTAISNPDGTSLGMAQLSWLAEKSINRIIEDWPVPRQTAESLLVRREGDHALYLTPLRHDANAALRRTASLLDTHLPASNMASNRSGVFDNAINYRKQPVLSYGINIKDSPWGLVTMIDLSEVQQPIINSARTIALVLGLILLLLYGAIYLLWRRGEVRHRLREADIKHEADARFRIIFEQSPLGVALIDSHTGQIYELNEHYASIAGRTREEMKNIDCMQITHPDDIQKDLDEMARLNAGEISGFQMNKRYLRPDGAVVWVNMTIAPVSVLPGENPRHLCLTKDITEQMANKQRTDEALRLLRIATRAADIGIWSLNLTTGELTWDEQMRAIYEAPAEVETNGQCYALWLERLHPEDREATESSLNSALASETTTWIKTFRLLMPDGRLRHIQSAASIETDDHGKAVRMVGVNRDISYQIQQEAALREAMQNAEQANRAKSAFLATMSHEIRTPLNAIIGTNYLLGLSSLTAEQRRDVQTIETSSKNLLALINDILDFSKIEAGEFTLETHPFSLIETWQDLRAMFSPLAALKHLAIHFGAFPEVMPSVLIGDGHRLRQILINLLSNAIKFTSKGQVQLTLEMAAGHTAQAPRFCFKVIDTGPGISDEALSRLFVAFKQADQSTSRQFGGSGLGLYIVKSLVDMMGGEISVQSQLGQGSTFVIELPFGLGKEANLPSHVLPAAARPLEVLVAEDDPTDRRHLMQLCSEFAWHTEGVENGQAMIDLVQRRLAEQDPIDCIVLDWHMPDIDGLATLEKLQAVIGATQMPSVIMVTAHDRDALKRAIRDIQPSSILTKPVDPSKLFNSVNEAVIAHYQDLSHVLNTTLLRSGHANWLDGIKVLVVDDSVMNLEVIDRILVSEGAMVTRCESGPAAIAALSGDATFDAVLMDLQMPVMDGCETTQKILEDPRHHKLPIIALTAGATTTEREGAHDSGMTDFLIKPVDPHQLVRVLRGWVEKSRGAPLPLTAKQASSLASTPVSTSEPTPASTPLESAPTRPAGVPPDWPALAGIDAAQAHKMTRGNVAFFKRMLELFETEHRDTLAQIKTALSSGKHPEAAELLHKLKGQAGNIGATELQHAAATLEAAVLAQAPDLITPLRQLQTACRPFFADIQ